MLALSPVSTYSPIESLFGKVKQIESISKLCWKKQVEIGQSIHKDIAPMMNYFISSIPEKQSKVTSIFNHYDLRIFLKPYYLLGLACYQT